MSRVAFICLKLVDSGACPGPDPGFAVGLDGNYQDGRLYLKHALEGLLLDDEYCRKTLEHLRFLWDRPVYLETSEPSKYRVKKKLYEIDERGLRVRSD